MDSEALVLSLRLASATTALLLLAGLPLSYWLATTRSRVRALIDAFVALPLVLPPTVIGFYLLIAFAPASLGRAVASVTGRTLPFTFPGLLLGSFLCNLPFAVRPFTAAFAAIERRHLEAAVCLGASRTGTFLRVALPLARPGIVAGCVLVFAHAVGEFGVALMIGGNIGGAARTLSIALYDDVQALDYERAGRTAAILVAFAFGALSVVHSLERRRRS